MSRSPLAYPLTRNADADVGGAADLQTDVMRFMAILSMCLLAIFALVQSIPLAPVETEPEPHAEPVVLHQPDPQPAPVPEPVETAPVTRNATPEPNVVLTRPKWVPKFAPAEKQVIVEPPPADTKTEVAVIEPPPVAPVVDAMPPVPEKEGFTLRFASDAALTRAVAAHHVGVYAIESGRARRMTVSESRISFWDASTPNTFHEMETGTVPLAVVDALARTGAQTDTVSWGVTLPGRMKSQLDSLMQAHTGGSLIITADGDIHWESS